MPGATREATFIPPASAWTTQSAGWWESGRRERKEVWNALLSPG